MERVGVDSGRYKEAKERGQREPRVPWQKSTEIKLRNKGRNF